jgi:hypothetical protein
MMTTFRLPCWTVLLAAALLAAAPARAQTVGGTGFGALVNAAGMVQRSSTAVLPSTGGYAVGDDQTFGVGGTLASEWLTSVTTGAVDQGLSSAQTSSSVEGVSVLGGLIRADVVTAIASSYKNATQAFSDAEGSGFAGLVVNGVALAADPVPNTRLSILGGFVVLNEQIRSGDGVTSSGITVNMIHVVLQSVTPGLCTPLGCTPEVTTTVGEVIVGSASSRAGS